ncbi:unnamed protein product [Brachionus calyciflorus]|uniref:Tc1-like transposase DDE domain-containing protein n=1 Tax=Brachionus calyciflorus TaxID=104777 RepID=A0A813PFR7_9BILA|nr:unnamed protein product [Brachionus calyciflorus]
MSKKEVNKIAKELIKYKIKPKEIHKRLIDSFPQQSYIPTLEFRRVRTKPRILGSKDKAKRLSFALNNLERPLSNLLFADETAFQINKQGIYHMRKAKTYPKSVALKKRNSATVNIWLAISVRCPTEPICFTNYLNSFGYRIILDHLIEFVDKTYETRCYLIQDND